MPDPDHRRQLDIWYSLVWGARSALLFGFLVVLITSTFGVILGVVSAYLGGWPNTLMMGFTDAFLAFPVIAGVIFFQHFILLLLRNSGAYVYFNGMVYMETPTAWQLFLLEVDPLMIAFIVFCWMPYARLMNSTVIQARQEEYLLASRSQGAGHLRLIFRHLIPNSISPAIILAARDLGYLVLLQAGFTFIGLSDRSEWGELLALGRQFIIGPGGNPLSWWWIYLPTTLAIVLYGVGWNLLGDGLNDWLKSLPVVRSQAQRERWFGVQIQLKPQKNADPAIFLAGRAGPPFGGQALPSEGRLLRGLGVQAQEVGDSAAPWFPHFYNISQPSLFQTFGLLPGQVLDAELEHADLVPVFFDLTPAIVDVAGGEAGDQGFEGSKALLVEGEDPHRAKRDRAAVVGRKRFGHHHVLGDDAVRDLRVRTNAVELVTCESTMEVELAVLVDVAERDGVGVAVIARDRQNARGGGAQDFDGFGFGQGLLFSAHFSEHEPSNL